jgi:hypothetical protein
MRYSIGPAAFIGLWFLSIASAVPPPSRDGFPNPSQAQLTTIQNTAQGSLPNGSPPASITEDTKNSLRLIAFNELFEVSFFTTLINKVETGADGFELDHQDKALSSPTSRLS